MTTFGNSLKPTYKLVLVVGFCPANENARQVNLILQPDIWTEVQAISKVDRYVVLTPRLTNVGYLSNKNQKVGMTPMVGHLEKNWKPMTKEEWIGEIHQLSKSRHNQIAIAQPEMWNFPTHVAT